ncbi:MAG: transcriptional repressor [Chloroflexi bacterium]|nr:transcriptional repressor [Chloroflexota bacterium]
MSSESKNGGVLRALLESGVRITEQRKLVASIMDEGRSHPDADEIYRRARTIDPRISLSTVYRTLALLKSEGLVQDHRFDEEHAHFEPVVDKPGHQHIICQGCGDIMEFQLNLDPAQRAAVEDATGFQYVSERIEVMGVCGNCRNKDS